MSTIQSSNEHLTINASGAGKEIKLQNNGTTNVTVASDGNLGVGTSSPSQTCVISGTLGVSEAGSGLGRLKISTSSAGAIIDQNDNSDIIFKTQGVERARIRNAGGITFNGDTAAANALDDYEEGTFGNTEAGWTVDGRYVKIGRIVWVSGQATLSSATTNRFMHMPFSSTNEIGTGTQAGNILRNTSSTYATSDYVAVYSTTNDLYVYSSSGSTRGTPSNGVFSFNFWYPTNS